MTERISTLMLAIAGVSAFGLFTQVLQMTDDWLVSYPVLALAIALWIWAALQFGLILGGRSGRE